MTLRTKTILYSGVALLGLLLAVAFTSSRVLLSGYVRIERDLALKNIDRVRETLASELGAMSALSADWSLWDDTYAFMESPDDEFIQKNLNDETIANIQLNLILFLRPSGDRVYGTGFDLDRGIKTPAPESLKEHLRPEGPLLHHTDSESSAEGLLLLPEGPLMVVSRPIMTSERQGPIRGAVVFGRWFDQKAVERIHKIVLRPVAAAPLGPAPLPGDFEAAWADLRKAGKPVIQAMGLNRLAGFASLADLYGRPAVIFRVDIDRDIMRQGRRSLLTLMLWLILAGGVFGLLTLGLLEKNILAPLTRLSTGVRRIQSRADSSERLTVEGGGELGQLAARLNAMLGALQQAEEARRESESHYRVMFREMTSGFALHEILCDDQGRPRDYRFLDVNPAFERLTGLSREKILGRTALEVLPQLEPSWIERYGRVALTGEPASFEDYAHELKRSYEVMAYAPRKGQFAVIFTDVTEQRRREEEQMRIQKLESLGVLAGGIAHDFNNLLTAILGNIHMTRTALRAPDSEADTLLNEAENAAARAKELTRQLLTFAQGGAPIKKISDLRDTIRESAAFTLHGSASRCVIHIAEDLWPADVDLGQISQVIQNLVLNADQAMPEGGTVTIRARNVPPEEASGLLPMPGPCICIEVSDTGIGIPEKHRPKLFDPYFTTKQKGSGLGLATSLSIVRKYGGQITVDSKVGAGSTFRVYLPASGKAVEAPAVSKEAAPAPVSARILVVDDEAAVRRLMVRMLSKAGYEVETAEDGQKGIQLYQAARQAGRRFDLVMLDLTIPGGMGGKEALAELRKIEPGVKAIIASGYATDPVMAQHREAGFIGVVTKPFRMAELIAAVRQALS